MAVGVTRVKPRVDCVGLVKLCCPAGDQRGRRTAVTMCIPAKLKIRRWQHPSSSLLSMSSKAEACEPIDRRLHHHVAWPVVVWGPDQEKPQNGGLSAGRRTW